MIKISGGYLKGRSIGSPAKAKGVRPTTQRVKLAIFSMLGHSVINSKVLDLYACTGALGIEAISRGALQCDFVEKRSRNCGLISKNLKTMEVISKGEVHQAEVLRCLKRSQGGYDLGFLDPPFELNEWEDVMNEVGRVGLLNDGGTVITEHRFKSDLKESYGNINRIKDKSYGDSKVTIYEVVSG